MILRHMGKRWVCFSIPCEDTEIDNQLNHVQIFVFVNLLRTQAVILTIQPLVTSFPLLKHTCILISTIQPSPMGMSIMLV